MVGHSILGVGDEKSFISMFLSPSWANGSLQKDKRKKEQGITLSKISATALNYSLTTFGDGEKLPDRLAIIRPPRRTTQQLKASSSHSRPAWRAAAP
jgi:hypothetical protein